MDCGEMYPAIVMPVPTYSEGSVLVTFTSPKLSND